jgi:hypothetical protein
MSWWGMLKIRNFKNKPKDFQKNLKEFFIYHHSNLEAHF